MDNILNNKTVEKIEENKTSFKIYFTDGVILEIWAANKFHSGLCIMSKLINNNS